jgi:hypothetical protein
MTSIDVWIFIPSELFEELCTAGKAANKIPPHVMEHEPFKSGSVKMFNLYRNDAVSDIAKGWNGTGTRLESNNSQTMLSYD